MPGNNLDSSRKNIIKSSLEVSRRSWIVPAKDIPQDAEFQCLSSAEQQAFFGSHGDGLIYFSRCQSSMDQFWDRQQDRRINLSQQ